MPTSARDTMLEVSGLSAGYLGKNVVEGIDIEVGAGEAVVIIGSNGAGKSTLFRAVCGLLAATAGRRRGEYGSTAGTSPTGRPSGSPEPVSRMSRPNGTCSRG